MLRSRIALGVSLLLLPAFLISAAPASAAPCDPIVERGNALQSEFQKWTEAAYSDGVITGEEAQKAEEFTNAQAKTTAELGECIGGTRPFTSGFELSGETFKTVGGFSLRISWETNVPSKALITFQRQEKGKDVKVGALHVHWKEGGIVFHGKVGGVKLKPGKYLLTLVETDGAGHESAPEEATLRIVAPKH